MVAGMVIMLMAATAYFVRFDGAGLIGLAIGVGLGLVNMAVSLKLTASALRDPSKGMDSALLVLLGGFFARLTLLIVLTLAFQGTPSISATAFAMGFMVLFFLNLMLEMLVISRMWQGNGGTA